MTSTLRAAQRATAVPPPRETVGRGAARSSSAATRALRLSLLLLSAPLLWLGLVYIAALAALLITAFWTVDSFTGEISQTWTLDNIITVAHRVALPDGDPAHRRGRRCW